VLQRAADLSGRDGPAGARIRRGRKNRRGRRDQAPRADAQRRLNAASTERQIPGGSTAGDFYFSGRVFLARSAISFTARPQAEAVGAKGAKQVTSAT